MRGLPCLTLEPGFELCPPRMKTSPVLAVNVTLYGTPWVSGPLLQLVGHFVYLDTQTSAVSLAPVHILPPAVLSFLTLLGKCPPGLQAFLL